MIPGTFGYQRPATLDAALAPSLPGTARQRSSRAG